MNLFDKSEKLIVDKIGIGRKDKYAFRAKSILPFLNAFV